MEQRKIISAVDYILHEERLKEDSDVAIFNVTNYANFLKQTPNIGMFVPAKEVDGVRVILEEPMAENYFNVDIPIDKFTDEDGKGLNKYHSDLLFWEEAKNRVVFEGFKYIYYHKDKDGIKECSYHRIKTGIIDWYFNFYDNGIIKFVDKKINTIEDFVGFNLTLTKQKAKELGL